MKEDKKIIILEASIDALYEKGPASFRVRDITKRTNISLGIINYHFLSKGGLYKKLITYISDKLIKFIDFKIDKSKTADENFRDLIIRMNEIFVKHKKEIKVFLNLKVHAQSFKTYKPYFKDAENEIEEYLKNIVKLNPRLYKITVLKYKFWSSIFYSFLVLDKKINLRYINLL